MNETSNRPDDQAPPYSPDHSHTYPIAKEGERIVITDDDRLEIIKKPELNELYKALAVAQGQIKAAEASSEADMGTYKYRYADLAACLEVIRQPLSENGLCLIQIPALLEGEVFLETTLGHESGQSISCNMSMRPDKGGPQAIGTCITYLRRYSLSAMIGVAQFDDDAASATKGPDEYDRMTARDIDEILVKADELFGDDADQVLEDLLHQVFPDHSHIADIPADQLKAVLRRLVNAKKKRDKKAKDAEKSPVAEPKTKPNEPDQDGLPPVARQEADEREPGQDDE